MEHSVNEYVEEEDEVIHGEGSEDGDSNDDDDDGDGDDMDDQDWLTPHTFHYYDLILVSCNLCFILKHFNFEYISHFLHSVLFQTFWL